MFKGNFFFNFLIFCTSFSLAFPVPTLISLIGKKIILIFPGFPVSMGTKGWIKHLHGAPKGEYVVGAFIDLRVTIVYAKRVLQC